MRGRVCVKSLRSFATLVWHVSAVSILHILLGLLLQCEAQTAPLQYSILEERPPLSFVADLSTDSALPPPEVGGTIVFTFLPQTGDHSGYFDLDASTGVLRTADSLDHEVICPQQTQCALNIKVKAETLDADGRMADFNIILATINVEDLNDNGPVFTPNVIELSIPESAMLGSAFGITSAYDPDSGINSVQNYHLEPNDVFDIEVTSLSDSSVAVQLIVTSQLDYETQNNYTLQLVASDGGAPQHNGSATLDITITDANDNSPVFIDGDYDVTLPEDTPVGTTIFTVLAYDVDSGENGEVSYGFSEETVESIGGVFEINVTSGDIYVSRNLDYEERKIYQLSVTATDNGPSPLPTYQQLKVTVTNVNDLAPTIIISVLGEGQDGEAAVPEKAPAGSFVAQVIFSDPDGDNVTCELNSLEFALAPLNTGDHQIITTREFDREVQDLYTVSLTCTDDGVPPMTTTAWIDIHITDKNDNAPEFSPTLYVISLEENQPAPVFVTQVTATDVDLGVNSLIEYSFQDPDTDTWLRIDSESGLVETVRPLDYETISYMVIYVLAKDQGRVSHTATATIQLTIEDSNDQTAIFTNTSYTMNVKENMPVNTTVGKVTATDSDSFAHNAVAYYLEWPYGIDRVFRVHNESGWITTTEVLDREAWEVYQFRIRAYNPSIPSMLTHVNVTINILDENDNAPRFIMPNESHKRFQIPSELPEGLEALQAVAVDEDLGQNAVLTYSMTCNEECMRIFAINSSGSITAKTSLTEYGTTSYLITLLATDDGLPPLSTAFDCTLVVNTSVPFLAPPEQPITFFWQEWGLDWRTMAAVGAALLLFIILVIFACWVFISRRRNKKKRVKDAVLLASQQDALLLNGGCGAAAKDTGMRQGPDGIPAITIGGVHGDETSTDGHIITWPPSGVDIGAQLVGGVRVSRPGSVNSNSTQASHAELNDSTASSWPDPGPRALHHSHETGLDLRPPQQAAAGQLPRPGSFSGPLSRSYDSDLEKEVRSIYNLLLASKDRDNSADADAGSFTDSGRGGSEHEDYKYLPTSDQPHARSSNISLPELSLQPDIQRMVEQLAAQQIALREYAKLPPSERARRSFFRNSLLDDSISENEAYEVTRPFETSVSRDRVHRLGSYNEPSTSGARHPRHPSSDSEIAKAEMLSLSDQYLNTDQYEDYLHHSGPETGYVELPTQKKRLPVNARNGAVGYHKHPPRYNPRYHDREMQRRLQGLQMQYGGDGVVMDAAVGSPRLGRERLDPELGPENRHHRPHRGKRRTTPMKRPPYVHRSQESNTSDDSTQPSFKDFKRPRALHVEEYELERLRHRRTLSDESDDTTRPISSQDERDGESPDVPSDEQHKQDTNNNKDVRDVQPFTTEDSQNAENERRSPKTRVPEHTNHNRTYVVPRTGRSRDFPNPMRRRRIDDVSSTDIMSDGTTTSGSYAMSDGTEYVV